MLRVLRRGSEHHELVELVQEFLAGRDLYFGEIDKKFGPMTESAVRLFQLSEGLDDDGVVGNETWGALMKRGLVVLESDTPSEDRRGPNWPMKPAGLAPLNSAQRAERFGVIEFAPEPRSDNPEAIRITNDWKSKNIVIASIPQLDRVKYAPGRPGVVGDERFACHALVKEPLEKMFTAWERAGLLNRILTWGGCWAPRFVRGSRSTLSAHAWGTAIDINVPWNGLGATPALVGRKGSVRELVEIATEHGFYWGGWFKRLDGMHFELARV